MSRKGYRSPEGIGTGMVESVIESYGTDGAIRALAQEPVQNAKDAGELGKVVQVEYRLIRRFHNGIPCYLLTVTDRGTSGLCGRLRIPREELRRMSEDEKHQQKWVYFERVFDSNKRKLDIGSRGQGKSVFLHHSHIPGNERRMMMLYDTLLPNGEYRLGEIAVYEDEYGIRKNPFLNSEAEERIQRNTFVNDEGDIKVPLGLESLKETGTRVIVPWLSREATDLIRNRTLYHWMRYLWWPAIVKGELKITIIDEVGSETEVTEPEWWEGEFWSGETFPPNQLHKSDSIAVRVHEHEPLDNTLTVQRFVILYDEKLQKKDQRDEIPDYNGIQIFRNGQCIETYWTDAMPIPRDKKSGMRAFIEFDEETEEALQNAEKTQHDGFDWNKYPTRKIKAYLIDRLTKFCAEMGWIEDQSESATETSRHHLRTNQFVFDTLLKTSLGKIPTDENGEDNGKKPDKPWDVDVLLIYPNANANSSRVNWGESIRNIRFVVNSAPENVRRNTRYALEWIEPDGEPVAIWSKDRINRSVQEYRIGDRRLVKQAINDRDIVCTKPGIYRIRAVVYEGSKLVAKKALRIHLEMDRPPRLEEPYTVSISMPNQTAPGELRIQSGDILNLQINGRNRTFDPISAVLFVRMREGSTVIQDKAVQMPAKPLGQDDRRHNLHWQQLRIVHPGSGDLAGDDDDIQTLTLDSGQHVMQAYLLNGSEELAYGPYTLHFESEPGGSQGNIPFEPKQTLDTNSPPMWDLRMEESSIFFPKEYPLLSALPQPRDNTTPFEKQNAFSLEISINGILEWALDPLYENNSTNLEALKASKPELSDDAIWDEYIERLSYLAYMVEQSKNGTPPSLIEFGKQWRRTVASVYPVLRSAR